MTACSGMIADRGKNTGGKNSGGKTLGLTLGILAESQNLSLRLLQNLGMTLGKIYPDPGSSATSLSYVRKLSVHSTSFND